MNQFKTDEEWRLAKHTLKFAMRRLILNYRADCDISQDLIAVINAYEHLYGSVKDDRED